MKRPWINLQGIQVGALRNDLTAGITGAVVGIPQAMGFALIAGISPIYGLYTAVISTLVASFIVRSTLLTVGPTNALALVVASTLAPLDTGIHPQALFTLTLLVGIIQTLFGAFRFQRYIRLVSHPVMTGFISGAALLIILGQMANLTGYTQSSDVTGIIPHFFDWLVNWPAWDPATLLLGVIALVTMFALRYTRVKYFSALLVIVAVSIMVPLLDATSVRIVSDLVPIPSGLPAPEMPDFGLIPQLLPAALSMALLALIQSVGITQAVPQMETTDIEDNRDFLGQGVANIVGGFFQNMPSGGSLSRTAVNISAGAQTRLSNVLSAVFIGITLIFLNSAVESIVLAALAAQLIIAAVGLINLNDIVHVWRVSNSGRLAMLTTFAATLLLPLEYSILVGVMVHLIQYVMSSSRYISVTQLIYDEESHLFDEQTAPDQLETPITILSIQGNLFFAGVPQLQQQLPKPGTVVHPVVIMRMRNISYLGTTGIRALADYADDLKVCEGRLILAGVSPHIYEQLQINQDVEAVRNIEIFPAKSTIFGATFHGMESAKKWLDQYKANAG